MVCVSLLGPDSATAAMRGDRTSGSQVLVVPSMSVTAPGCASKVTCESKGHSAVDTTAAGFAEQKSPVQVLAEEALYVGHSNTPFAV